MKTIKKRADELTPGDVFPWSDKRRVVVADPWETGDKKTWIVYVTVGIQEPSLGMMLDRNQILDVESNLTPAQEHADALAGGLRWMLGWCETYAREAMGPAAPEFHKARDLLAKIDPPKAPTYEEALAALDNIARNAREGRQTNFAEIDSILGRARRANVMPSEREA